MEGDNPVCGWVPAAYGLSLNESSCLGLQLKVGGKFHPKLNMGGRPIANKYREGKMKRTLKRELKVLEIAEREPKETSVGLCCTSPGLGSGVLLRSCLVRVGSMSAGDGRSEVGCLGI